MKRRHPDSPGLDRYLQLEPAILRLVTVHENLHEPIIGTVSVNNDD